MSKLLRLNLLDSSPQYSKALVRAPDAAESVLMMGSSKATIAAHAVMALVKIIMYGPCGKYPERVWFIIAKKKFEQKAQA